MESAMLSRRLLPGIITVAALSSVALVSHTQSVSDTDSDGIPDAVESSVGRNAAVKDNDIFADARLFVMQQYRDFLGREADAAGLEYWQQALSTQATSRSALLESYVASNEFQSSVGALTRLYIATYQRLPDTDGMSFWLARLRIDPSAANLVSIAQSFATTPEFVGRYGNLADSAFIDQIYLNVLGRAADTAGQTFWLQALRSGKTRGDLLLAFTQSSEYQARMAATVYVVATYYGMLRRTPDQTGYETWVNYLLAGNAGRDLVNQFLEATEYRARFLPALATTPVAPVASVANTLTINLNAVAGYATPILPRHYDANAVNTDNTPADNPVSDRGATLGRVLFYDKQLSRTNTVACASCHQQGAGFGDTRRFSIGVDGAVVTSAHSMRLGNLAYFGGRSMFWDRRSPSVEAQATQPVQNALEMGFDAAHGGIAAAVAKLQALPYYQELFTWVYGDGRVTEDRVQKALAQFERAMISTGSAFDTAYAQVYDPNAPQRGLTRPFPGFTPQQERGKQLFINGPGQGGAGCAACHQPPTFALVAGSRSNGLDAGETVIFKSPSLKNVAISGAFMHDGRMASLEQVVEHYNSGIQNGPALDNRLRQGPNPQRLNLSDADKAALVAFMRTLTDTALQADARFSDPFRR
jgi:cytochrome c peroxidase